MEKVKRINFLDVNLVKEFMTSVQKKEPFLFKPLDYKCDFSSVDFIGIAKCGLKIIIRLLNLPFFVDVRIPEGESDTKIVRRINDICNSIKGASDVKMKNIRMYPGKELRLTPSQYLRIYFKSTHCRKKFIELAFEHGLETANCDTKYELLLSRIMNMETCGWNLVFNYTEMTNSIAEKTKIRYQFEIDWKDIISSEALLSGADLSNTPSFDLREKYYEIPQFDRVRLQADINSADCIYDKLMVCAWDLETYTPAKLGGVPKPENPADEIKMCSMVLRWYWDSKNLYKIIISSCVVPEVPGVMTIITDDIPAAMAEVIEMAQPDFITGFNDGSYDWPFIKARIKDKRDFRARMCPIKFDPDNKYSGSICGPLHRAKNCYPQIYRVKIDAETTAEYDGYLSYGSIIFDTQFVMRRRDTTETKFKSLNSFLERYGIPPKEDMPYDKMARIFHIEEILKTKFKLETYEQMIEFLNQNSTLRNSGNSSNSEKSYNLNNFTNNSSNSNNSGNFTNSSNFASNSGTSGNSSNNSSNSSNFTNSDNSGNSGNSTVQGFLSQFASEDKTGALRICHMTAAQLLEHLSCMDKVVTYCIRDAEACIDLLRKINAISDICELGISSYTFIKHGFFNANGMKVRNKILYSAMKPIWGIGAEKRPLAFRIYSGPYKEKDKKEKKEDKKKFPGGYVPEPIMGFYLRTLFERRKARRSSTGGSDPDKKDFNPTLWFSDSELASIYGIATRRPIHYTNNAESFEFYYSLFKNSAEHFRPEVEQYFRDLDGMPVELYEQFCENKDYFDIHSRPCSGIDFASLYPSLIMTFNFSPEMYCKKNKLKDFPEHRFLRIETVYKEEKAIYVPEIHLFEGYFLQHTVDETGQITNHGIFPTILRILFGNRKRVKGMMGEYSCMLEKIHKEFPPEFTRELRTGKRDITDVLEFFDGKIKTFEGRELKKLEKMRFDYYKYVRSMFVKHLQPLYGPAIDSSAKQTIFSNFIKDAEFNEKLLNTKQNSMKVFMNTFYGEMGNPYSPFFIVEMAGGVTAKGRESLQAAQKFVESKGYNIYYGDTDSIYGSAPECYFAEIDRSYSLGEIGKIEFFERMVEITMDRMDYIVKEIAAYFKQTTGNAFLSMSYEEVMFPYMFLGKKHYIGVKHETSIDFSICGEKNPDKFMKGMLARGIATRKRDNSGFSKNNYIRILMMIFNLDEFRTIEQIIFTEIKNLIADRTQNLEQFKKNYNFASPRENTKTAQLRFRTRMLRLQIIEKANKCAYYLSEYLQGRLELKEFRGLLNYLYFFLKDGEFPFLDNVPYIEQYWTDFESKFDKVKIEILPPVSVRITVEGRAVMHGLSLTEKGIRIGPQEIEINRDWLTLEIPVPQFGTRENVIYALKPQKINLRGNPVKIAKGDLFEFPEFSGNQIYASLLQFAEGNGGIKINIQAYFEELFGKLSQFLIYYPKYLKLEKEGKKIDKKKTKDFVEKKLKESFTDSFEIVPVDPTFQKEKYAQVRKSVISECNNMMIREFLKRATEEKLQMNTALAAVSRLIHELTENIEFDRNRFLHGNGELVAAIRKSIMAEYVSRFKLEEKKFYSLYCEMLTQFRTRIMWLESSDFAELQKLSAAWEEVIWLGRYQYILKVISDKKAMSQKQLLKSLDDGDL